MALTSTEYTDALNKVLLSAGEVAKRGRYTKIKTAHLVYFLLTTKESRCQKPSKRRLTIFGQVIAQAGGYTDDIIDALVHLLNKVSGLEVPSQDIPPMSPACLKVMQAAARSRDPSQELVAIDHCSTYLLLSLMW
jgi:hypothetical protein